MLDPILIIKKWQNEGEYYTAPMRISNNILGRGSNLELKDIKLAQVISINYSNILYNYLLTIIQLISWQSYSWSPDNHTADLLTIIQLISWQSYSWSPDNHTADLLTIIQLISWQSYSWSPDNHTADLLTIIQLISWQSYSWSPDNHTADLLTIIQLSGAFNCPNGNH